jgi:hypothetical protein
MSHLTPSFLKEGQTLSHLTLSYLREGSHNLTSLPHLRERHTVSPHFLIFEIGANTVICLIFERKATPSHLTPSYSRKQAIQSNLTPSYFREGHKFLPHSLIFERETTRSHLTPSHLSEGPHSFTLTPLYLREGPVQSQLTTSYLKEGHTISPLSLRYERGPQSLTSRSRI